VVRLAHIPKLTEGQIETGFDRECVSSNPLTPANQSVAWRFYPPRCQKCPQVAGFYDSTDGLQVPSLATSGSDSPIVSGRYSKYSRFRETAAGDSVRSTLPGRPCVAFEQRLSNVYLPAMQKGSAAHRRKYRD